MQVATRHPAYDALMNLGIAIMQLSPVWYWFRRPLYTLTTA
jgi:hypothetical protein